MKSDVIDALNELVKSSQKKRKKTFRSKEYKEKFINNLTK
jgi:hypothetical protein